MRLTRIPLPLALFGSMALTAPAFAGPADHSFKHIIIVFQENRTPDNLFGSAPHFEPGVDIEAKGIDSKGNTIPFTPEPIAGCYDIGHGHQAFETMLQLGPDQESVATTQGCIVPANPQFKFADNSTGNVQPYFDIAENYSFANRMFQTNQGPSFPAHQFIFAGTSSPSTESPLFASSNLRSQKAASGCIAPAGQTVQLIDSNGNATTNAPIYPCLEHPTLSDVLNQANVTWHYYAASATGIWVAPNAVKHVCDAQMVGTTLECQGPDWLNGNVQTQNPAKVLRDIRDCELPSVSWVMPTAEESDHSSVTNGTGPQWVANVVNVLGGNPPCSASGEDYWHDTAIIITWDDWGGWSDHVKPFAINVEPNSPPAWGDGYTYGFRVPMMVVSAYTPSGYVDNTIHDFGSILYFVEHNFNLGFIGPGDTIYSNYADYQAYLRRDDLSAFFSLRSPRKFVKIGTTLPPDYFLNLPHSTLPVDDE